MVILSSAICTKNGKALLSRQFVEMSRLRIEGLLAAFPKLLTSGEDKQHTFIETDTVRYLYQPIEALFLLVITNKASNIVEDLETLRLLSKVVPDVAGGVTEERVCDKCFDLVFAFDEVITTGGYRENITLQQIRTNMEMESHEEKLHNMIKQSKMDSAKDQAARQAKAIRERQREMARDRQMSGGGGGFGKGGNQYVGMGGGDNYDSSYSGGYGGGRGGSPTPSFPSALGAGTDSYNKTPETAPRAATKGMKLGAASKASSMLDSLVQEDNLSVLAAPPQPSAAQAKAGSSLPPPPPVQNQPIMLVVEEKVTVHLTKDGGVDAFEVKGGLTLTVTNEMAAACQVQLANQAFPPGVTFQTHPKVNKQAYDQNKVLVLKDASKGFPNGRPVGVLRWSLSSSDESMVPLSINCWPDEEGQGKMLVNIEYSLQGSNRDLHDVQIVIPLGTNEPPEVVNIDGTFRHDAREHRMIWHMDMIDESNAEGRDPGAFFPIAVSFMSQGLYADVAVQAVTSIENKTPIPYSITKALTTDSYVVG